ncbi:MAG: pyruvate kinase [Clostridiales bacterium]|nr:pyruvate kinase [Clostridiales bacterium]
MRKTKIICTLGPATDKDDVLKELMLAGMNVARMNFSHGSHAEHLARLEKVKLLRKELNLPIAILLDTKGPEIRLQTFKNNKVLLEEGQEFTLTTKDIDGDNNMVSITYKNLFQDVKTGSHILIDDGLIDMEVVKIYSMEDDDGCHHYITCKVINGGYVSDRKGVNVPNAALSMPYLSDKDMEDIRFGVKHDVDFIAASFVRSAEDVKQLRYFLGFCGNKDIKIIAKIENAQGVNNIDEIIDASDGIMVARGDMGVEIPGEEVPVIQKMIIKKVYKAGKQVITATQMLDSMMKNPRPTRAETTDVANAIYDGTSAIMLSGETAAGHYPVESVRTMVRIAERTEGDIDYHKRFTQIDRQANPNITDAISHATCTTAMDLNAKAIITVTKSGSTARMISKYRPSIDVICGTTDEKVCRQLNMSWGVTPFVLDEMTEVFSLFNHAISKAKDAGYLEKGDITVITAGVPLGHMGTTNMIKIQEVE